MLDFEDLHNVITVDTSHEAGYCAQHSSFTQYNNKSGKDFQDWEDEIAKPALIAAGFKLLSAFLTGDRDSFGPLTRYITVEKDGRRLNLIYG